jgi:hypothetical protein
MRKKYFLIILLSYQNFRFHSPDTSPYLKIDVNPPMINRGLWFLNIDLILRSFFLLCFSIGSLECTVFFTRIITLTYNNLSSIFYEKKYFRKNCSIYYSYWNHRFICCNSDYVSFGEIKIAFLVFSI